MGTYAILIYQDEAYSDHRTEAERAALLERHGAFHAKHGAAIKAGQALQPTGTARTMRDELVTDGPFVETKEALGGVYVIDAADLDAAIAIATDVPAPHGGVEVRPVVLH